MASLDVSSALFLMGLVGLSDAFVYLKRFDELSRGQQYRVMLARLMAAGRNVWLVDEFCANLDPVTANVVSDKLQSIARELGATVVLGAPHCESFISALRPDKVVQLTTSWEHTVIRGDEFLQELRDLHLLHHRMQSLRLRPELLAATRSGQKQSTIRRGRRQIRTGLLVLESRGESLLVHVTGVTYKRFGELTEEDAQGDGYQNLAQLREELRSYYPKLRKNSPLTVVEFELTPGKRGRTLSPALALAR